MKMSDVKFAIPKGRLEDATFKLLEKSWTQVNRQISVGASEYM